MSENIWVFVETKDGTALDSSLAIVTEATRLASKVSAQVVGVVIGESAATAAAQAGSCGADTVVTVEGTEYAEYSTEGFTNVFARLVEKHDPSTILFAATTCGNDLAPRVAARCATGMVSDATSLTIAADGTATFTKSTLGGNLRTECVVARTPQLGTVRTGLFKKGSPTDATPAMVREDISTPASEIRTSVLKHVVDETAGELGLEDADIVIAGGRAMGSAENFAVLGALAAAFGPTAAVGSSRPAADSGWVSPQQEIGISGKTVSPDLYLACGISGASQHLAGMSSSKVIVAINKDPDAPIFGVADFGIVGDLFEIVPALTAAVTKARS